jgi:hypothetical protein
MARIRTNNVFGTTTDNPLTAGATTMNSAGLANLGVVAGSDEALITLDPNRVNGAPEIVRVTAHTGSATSGTIVRGLFGTAARSHPLGTEWVHAPVAAAGSQLDGDFGGIWETYTPSNTNITVGNGTQAARFTRIGDTIHWSYELLWGSTTSFGGTIQVGLPAAALSSFKHAGGGVIEDAGTRDFLAGLMTANTTSVFVIHSESGNVGRVDATNPMTWTTSDRLVVGGTYEAA